MGYYRICYRVARDQCELLIHALEQQHALSVSVENAGGPEHFDTAGAADPEWEQVAVTGLFPDTVDPSLIHRDLSEGETPLVAPDSKPEVECLAERDWQRSYMQQFQPLQVAPGLWICPSWVAPPDPEATNIVLDPGLAFGTGSHATTALCLRWLAAADLAGASVMDYGCGSGILALAALKMGAEQAIALDIDPRALRATWENAERNGLADSRLQVTTPQQLAADTQADVLVANILAGTLVDLAQDLRRLTAPNGTILLSGILKSQMAQVHKAFEPDFDFTSDHCEEWCLLIGKSRTSVAVREHNE